MYLSEKKQVFTYYFFDNKAGTFIELRDGFVLGRLEGDQQFPSDDLLSRKHCQVHIVANDVYVVDFGSTNKTKVNGVPIVPNRKRRVQLNDVIEFGHQRMILTNQNKRQPSNIQEAGLTRRIFKSVRTLKGELTTQVSRILTQQTRIQLDTGDYLRLKAKEFKSPRNWDPSSILLSLGLIGFWVFWGLDAKSMGGLQEGLSHHPYGIYAKLGAVALVSVFVATFFQYLVAMSMGGKWWHKLFMLPFSICLFVAVWWAGERVTHLTVDVEENATVLHCVKKYDAKICKKYAREGLEAFLRLPKETRAQILDRLPAGR